MTTDRYTKFILTVIALCLVWLCATSSPRVVKAQKDSVQHIVIDDVDAIITGDGLPVHVTGPIEMKTIK
jgi:hypothetical protein